MADSMEPQYAKGIPQHVPPRPHKAAGTGQHRVKYIEAFPVRPRWLFVRLETTTGIVGWGEASLSGHEDSVMGSLQDIERRIVDWDAMNIEEIWQHLYRQRFQRGGPAFMTAMAGVDIALWDIKGKVLGVPVWELLGGKVRDQVEVYGPLGSGTFEELYEKAKKRKAQGYTKVKLQGPFNIGWFDSPAKLDETVEKVKAIKALGLDVAIDFHGRLHKGLAKQVAKLLEPIRPFFIEEPLLPHLLKEQSRLYDLSSVPIALGERLFTREDCRPYFESGCIDIIQPDVTHAGGISECKKIAAMAETYDVGFAPHCPNGPIAFAASMQLNICVPNFIIQETGSGNHFHKDGIEPESYLLDAESFKITNGMVGLPTEPGLGIRVDEERIRKESEEYFGKGWRWQAPRVRGPGGEIREW